MTINDGSGKDTEKEEPVKKTTNFTALQTISLIELPDTSHSSVKMYKITYWSLPTLLP